MLRFKEFLLEYNEDKNWEIHGPKITSRLKSQGIEDNHKEFWNKKIQDHDPTRNKEYGQWISRTYANGGINHHEDIGSRVGPALEKYHKAKISKKLATHSISADINTHKTLGHLEDSVEKLPQEETDSKKISNDEATKHDEKHWTVITPHTEAASRKYGKGTRWCTAADRNCMFNRYHDDGPLHIYIPKNPKHPGEKYQVHTNSLSFMDEKDKPIDDRDVFKDRPSPHYEKHGINDEHISRALEDRRYYIRLEAVRHPRATSEHISKALDDGNDYVREAAVLHPNLTPKHISKALNDDNYVVRKIVIQHPNATPEHITMALNDDNYVVRANAIEHPKATPEHISKALDDDNVNVRYEAIRHPKATPEHISKALDDTRWSIRAAAIKHPKVKPEHITKALDDENPSVRARAIRHPKVTPEHISKALDDTDWPVRAAAIEHPKATPEHISKALEDRNEYVRGYAETLRKKMQKKE